MLDKSSKKVNTLPLDESNIKTISNNYINLLNSY